jgi:hypothetical protein
MASISLESCHHKKRVRTAIYVIIVAQIAKTARGFPQFATIMKAAAPADSSSLFFDGTDLGRSNCVSGTLDRRIVGKKPWSTSQSAEHPFDRSHRNP